MDNFFNLDYYLENNPDLIKAGITNYELAWEHWINHGKREGRKCINIIKEFDWKYYTTKYEDLDYPNEIMAYEHYYYFGKKEGRLINNLQEKVNKDYRKKETELRDNVKDLIKRHKDETALLQNIKEEINQIKEYKDKIKFNDKDKIKISKKEEILKLEVDSQEEINIKRISIVMAYYNRKPQTLETLKGFQKFYAGKYNFEVIIVDDNSNDEHKLQEDIKQFSYEIKLIEIGEKEKANRVNPGPVYNRGFQEVTGDVVIIQNPECLHLGNIIKFIENNLVYDRYLVFPCYNSNNYEVNKFIYENIENINIKTIEQQTKHMNLDEVYGKFPVWYQHPKIHDKQLHFCSAISSEYLQMISGFSDIYKDGVCFEDDDLLFKIKNYLKLNVISVPVDSDCGVVHLYHGRSTSVHISKNETNIKRKCTYQQFILNKNIYNSVINENNKISCPKIFHYYWDDFKKFSYLNLYSLRSSVYYHPDYIHVIWCPKNPNENISWKEHCNKKHGGDSMWLDYLNEINNMRNVKVIYKNMDKLMSVPNNMSEIHKSDLFRYFILEKYGGIWSDLDIVYIKKITDLINFDFNTLNFLCGNSRNKTYYIPIGLLMGNRRGKFFHNIYTNALDNYNKDRYQAMGIELFAKLFLENDKLSNFIQNSNQKYKFLKNNNKDIFLDEHFYIFYNWTQIDELFIKDIKLNDLEKNIAGFHWFNGSDITKKYLNEMKNTTIPSKFKGVIFKDKIKFHTKYSNVFYYKFEKLWTNFFSEKMEYYINHIRQSYQDLRVIEYNVDHNHVDHNHVDHNCTMDIGEIENKDLLKIWSKQQNSESLIIYDEISYNWLMKCYVLLPQTKSFIEKLLNNSNYIVFFCELFENEDLKIMDSKIHNTQFSKIFFKNARQILLCNTQNRVNLSKQNIINNITYFPPIVYSKNEKTKLSKEYEVDLLFYGSIFEKFEYRNKCIENIRQYSNGNKYKFSYINHGEDDILCNKSKIIIHIPTYENSYSFPWKNVSNLIQNRHFFIIEENEELYIQKLENKVVYYKRGDMNDLKNKIDYYLNNEKERIDVTQKLFEYFKIFNIDNLICDMIQNKF